MSLENRQKLTLGRVVRRLLLYIALALGALALIGVITAISIREHIRDIGPGLFLVGYTGLLVWVVVSTSRPYWLRVSFWLAVALLIAIHVFLFISVLHYYPAWRPLWYIPVVGVEAVLFNTAVAAVLRDKSRHHREM